MDVPCLSKVSDANSGVRGVAAKAGVAVAQALSTRGPARACGPARGRGDVDARQTHTDAGTRSMLALRSSHTVHSTRTPN